MYNHLCKDSIACRSFLCVCVEDTAQVAYPLSQADGPGPSGVLCTHKWFSQLMSVVFFLNKIMYQVHFSLLVVPFGSFTLRNTSRIMSYTFGMSYALDTDRRELQYTTQAPTSLYPARLRLWTLPLCANIQLVKTINISTCAIARSPPFSCWSLTPMSTTLCYHTKGGQQHRRLLRSSRRRPSAQCAVAGLPCGGSSG